MTYPGLYRGIVVDTNDPQGRLRVKVRVPAVSGAAVNWAEACVPPGWHDADRDLLQDHLDHGPHVFTDANDGTSSSGDAVRTLVHSPNHGAAQPHRLVTVTPRPGIEGVWVMYEQGDVEHPVWIGTYKIGAN